LPEIRTGHRVMEAQAPSGFSMDQRDCAVPSPMSRPPIRVGTSTGSHPAPARLLSDAMEEAGRAWLPRPLPAQPTTTMER
jgi:hypothetical protein